MAPHLALNANARVALLVPNVKRVKNISLKLRVKIFEFKTLFNVKTFAHLIRVKIVAHALVMGQCICASVRLDFMGTIVK